MSTLKRVLPLAAALALSGCLSSKTDVYSSLDPTEKTMTVPAGNAAIFGAIKDRLRQNGWHLVVSSGPVRTVGTIGTQTDLSSAPDNGTRYKLVGQWQLFDVCLGSFDPAIHYQLSVIDNLTGEEVVAQSGSDCVGRAAEKFVAALGGK